MATVRCPSCDQALEVEDEYRDWTVRCPHCGAEFVPDATVAAKSKAADEPRPRPRRTYRDERDDYDERPARRRRARRDDDDDYDDDYDPEDARRLVANPAAWLEIVGWLGVLLTIAGGGLLIAIGMANNNNNNPNAAADAAGMIFAAACLGVLGIPYSVAIAIGGRKMRNLSSRPWAMTAAILAVASFAMFGLCGLLHTGIGVWALVTLDNPAVRAAFGLPTPYRRRRRADWD